MFGGLWDNPVGNTILVVELGILMILVWFGRWKIFAAILIATLLLPILGVISVAGQHGHGARWDGLFLILLEAYLIAFCLIALALSAVLRWSKTKITKPDNSR